MDNIDPSLDADDVKRFVSSLKVHVISCPLLVRDKRPFEFTVTRSFLKLFRTGSAAVVDECQKFFPFLPVTYQIDIHKFYKNV